MIDAIKTTNQKFVMTDRTAYTRNRQKFLQQNIRGVMGSTWDATHMTSFLNRSFYSNKKSPERDQNSEKKAYSMRRKKSGDYFFKNLRYDQNKSHIGYSKVNPQIANIQVSKDKQKVLVDFFLSRTERMKQDQKNNPQKLLCEQNSKFKYEGNAVKFKATDPLTSRYEPLKPQKLGYSIERMRRQIKVRHPHGITGIDHPHNDQAQFYEKLQQKSARIRLDPTANQSSFQFDRQWKSKKRVIPISEQYKFRHTQCIRKFRNQNAHGYNIVTNCDVQ